ncbi:MAG: dTDP-4-dehydrorhamnose 3,5-epimerase [Victivallaceae bacterium]|nr:dTDP-4-dehydrorhamnose 3,5-epimerase [Victivallaceae bacterium]
MKVLTCDIAGLRVVEPKVFGDARGYFFEAWSQERYREAGIDANFIQDNESFSHYGVVRGLHYQQGEFAQAKLVRVIRGTVLDVAVDIRKDSATFGRHYAVELSGENKRQFFIPRGFAHGFAVLSEEAIFAYKCDNFYMPSAERGIRYDDPELGIDWRIPVDKRQLSEKDTKHPLFREAQR